MITVCKGPPTSHPALISFYCVLSPLGQIKFWPQMKETLISILDGDYNTIKQLLQYNNFCLSLKHTQTFIHASIPRQTVALSKTSTWHDSPQKLRRFQASSMFTYSRVHANTENTENLPARQQQKHYCRVFLLVSIADGPASACREIPAK